MGKWDRLRIESPAPEGRDPGGPKRCGVDELRPLGVMVKAREPLLQGLVRRGPGQDDRASLDARDAVKGEPHHVAMQAGQVLAHRLLG